MRGKHIEGLGRLITVAGLGLSLAGTVAADGRQAISAPPPPPPLQSGEPLEPEVTIRRTEREVVYEYRRNGQLYMVRVQPRFGPPYHFVDVNNDGTLDYQPGEPVRNNINQWILYRW
jgi:hypothetical protein